MSQKGLLVVGALGRMGQEIISLAETSGKYKILKFDKDSQFSNLNASDVDMIIDFSQPEVFSQLLGWARKNKKPVVSGTTGLNSEDFSLLKECGTDIPILWSPNMSLGVSLVIEMLKSFSKVESQFDFQVEEFHHKHKKDRPSGTAKWIKEELDKVLGHETPETLVARGGGVFGVHKVWAFGEEESIQIEHTAMNRRVFARGALMASEWLAGKPAKLYTMRDILF